jgi:hypothetical protein
MAAVMWPHVDPDQALRLAVQLCAVAQLVGVLELALVRTEFRPGGFLDWSMTGNLNPQVRTRPGRVMRRALRRLSPGVFAWLIVLDAVVACLLLARPSFVPLIAAAALLQLMLMKRHHLAIDGSDQMLLVVLVACLLGRIGADAVATWAAVSFLAAELTLAYLVAGVAKATSAYWRSGQAFPMIARTRMYGQPAARRVVDRFPWAGRAASYAVIWWESLFVLALIAPPALLAVLFVLGVGFHAGCAVVMGLNRFMWAFVASYPAVACTNLAIRSGLGAHTADVLTYGLAAAGILGLAFALLRRPSMPAHAGPAPNLTAQPLTGRTS